MKTVVIVGASGFIGGHLRRTLKGAGYEVIAVSRSREGNAWRKWGEGCLDGADIVFNFAGKSIDCRWTARVKQELVESRLESTTQIVKWIGEMEEHERPEVFLCASGIAVVAEDSGNLSPGADFLKELCEKWEEAAREVEQYGVRRVSMRFGAVLSKDAAAWKKMSMPYRFFVGGMLGDGTGIFTWIHLHDALAGMMHCMENEQLSGGVNFVAEGLSHREVAREIGKAMGRPSCLPVPSFAIRLALGEFADGLLVSITAEATQLKDAGYQFEYPTFKQAVAELVE